MRTAVAVTLLLTGAAVTASPAAAEDGLALMGGAAWMMPRGDVGEAVGGGAEARLIDDEATVGMSLIGLVGRTPAERRRDIMDVRIDAGLRPCKKCRAISPYLALGVDVLHVTTHEPTRSVRGSTLGLSAHAGLMGRIGDDGWAWRAGATYLGAIVPGTGEDLGGISLSFAVGKRIMK